MALLKEEADKLSNNDLVAGVIEEIYTSDDLYAILPFTRTEGKAYAYNREKTLSQAGFLSPNGNVIEGAATFDYVTTTLKGIIGDVDVDKFLNSTESDTSNQLAIQISAKVKGLVRTFKNALINGDATGSPEEFDGLVNLVDATNMTIVAGDNGASISFSLLDQLLDKIEGGAADVIIMRKGTARAYRQLLRAAGATGPVEIQLENFGKAMLSHNGIPIIINDYISATEVQGTNNATTSIYAARLNEADGLHGLFGGEAAGITVEDIGTIQNKDATRTRVKWYVGLCLKSTKSLARLKGITNV